jgi:hypothetical protein
MISPENLAKLARKMFPDESREDAMISAWEFYNAYIAAWDDKGSEFHAADTKPKEEEPAPRSWTRQPEPEPETSGQNVIPLTGIYNDPGLKKMMSDLLDYCKSHNINATELQKQIGASYPTILNWFRGRMPRGENIPRIREFLKKHASK